MGPGESFAVFCAGRLAVLAGESARVIVGTPVRCTRPEDVSLNGPELGEGLASAR
jgi:hypothetical protein